MPSDSQISVELTVRLAMIIKSAAEGIGSKDLIVHRCVIKDIREQLDELNERVNEYAKT